MTDFLTMEKRHESRGIMGEMITDLDPSDKPHQNTFGVPIVAKGILASMVMPNGETITEFLPYKKMRRHP